MKWNDNSQTEIGVLVVDCDEHWENSYHAIQDSWKHNGLNAHHPVSQYMSLTQFQEIKRYNCISSSDLLKIAPTGRQLSPSKVEVILEQLWKSLLRYPILSTNTYHNQCMIEATRSFPDTHQILKKPIEQGFSFHCLAGQRYIRE